MNCDRCGKRCGPTTGSDSHYALGKRWCERCWRKVGERKHIAKRVRAGWTLLPWENALRRPADA